MKCVRPRNPSANRAFTLLELLVVIAIVLILVAVITPTSSPCDHPVRARCLNNLKQVSLGYIMWQSDHGDTLPWRVATANGGTLESIEQGQALLHFESITNYLREPQVFTCPGDRERQKCFNKEGRLTASTLSYFVNLDTTTNWSRSILAGDRQLKLDGQSVQPGWAAVTTSSALSWLPGIHIKGAASGNLAFMDGHVESAGDNLNELFRAQGVTTNRLVIP